MKTPYDLYRPEKADDSQGGSLVTLDDPTTIWGVLTVHDETKETRMHVDIREDVRVGDIIVVEEED